LHIADRATRTVETLDQARKNLPVRGGGAVDQFQFTLESPGLS